MDLQSAPKSKQLEIVSINNDRLITDAMRFGIGIGENITIINRLPNGPIVIQKNELQIAIGQELAKAIEVKIKNSH